MNHGYLLVTLHSARPTQFLVVSVGQVFNRVHAQHCGIRQRGAALLEGMALVCILLDVITLVFILKCDLHFIGRHNSCFHPKM